MQLPHGERAVVDLNKIRDYLLSLTHPEGRTKARFFIGYGFTPEDRELLIRSLLRHARENDADLSKENKFGRIYTVEGPIVTPDGRNPLLRTVWIIKIGSTTPRLITAYPNP